jgi:Glycosyltransferases involved in cell wall biogenesis
MTAIPKPVEKGGDFAVAVVIPCYRVKRHILSVIDRIGPEVRTIYVVDDKCPEQSGQFVLDTCKDPRVRVLFHLVNQGVGGAVVTGYEAAIADGADAIVKVDGDGQMDPALIPQFVAPIFDGSADYTKGNRFFDLTNISSMPPIRIFGNAVLSFMSKLSSGYWDVFDPTNGYTAIHARVAGVLPLSKISRRYFFESDMLFRLNTVRARVVDVPMDAVYGDEESNLKIKKILREFLTNHLRNTVKRVFYNYFLRNFTIASIELLLGALLMIFGIAFGGLAWIRSAAAGVETAPGTVMLATLPIIIGLQFLLAFVSYDISSMPTRALHPMLAIRNRVRLHIANRAPETNLETSSHTAGT